MAEYPPNCGERFAHFVPKPCVGLGLGLLCDRDDIKRALDHAQKLNATLLEGWNESIRAENTAEPFDGHPVSAAWEAEYNAWYERYLDLPDTWEERLLEFGGAWFGREQAIFDQIVALCTDGACLLDA